MAFIFGGARPTNHECVRDYQRKITGSARGMEREIARLDTQEKSLQRDLAKCAQDSKLEMATTKAREMVRLRAHRGRLYTMKGHMTSLAQQLQSVQSSTKMQETLAATARMLQALNARFDAASVSRMLAEFERQTVLMTNTQEVVNDSLDTSFEVDGEQDAANDAVLAVLQEAGLDVQSRLKPAASQVAQREDLGEAEDLENRLARLRPRD
jgi:division protein CdvB (Snf7/Vps24/ESCRT-III family)